MQCILKEIFESPPIHMEATGEVVRLADVRADSSLELAKDFIERNYSDSIDLDKLASIAGISRFSFAKRFRSCFGVSPYHYVCLVRVRAAQELIVKGMRPTDIAAEVGFFDQSHLSKHFKRLCGMTPKQYQNEYCVQ